MTGTLYADIGQIRGDITGFTFSPVYQTADGQIYLAEGQRVTCSTQNLGRFQPVPLGQRGTDRKQQLERHQQNRAGFYRQTFLFCMLPKRCGCCRWMRISGVLGQADYPAAAVPEELEIFCRGAEFILLESRSTDTAGAEHTARQIIGRDELEDYGADGQMKYVTLYLRGDGPLAEAHAIALKG